jgi:hypothetical protein
MGDEESVSDGRKVFFWAVIGFVIMMIAEPLVKMVYGSNTCWGKTLFGVPIECTQRVLNASWSLGVIAKIIVILNGFIALTTVIMIMYAGFLILTGGGDEEKNDKAKKTIAYALIGVVILLFSYVIYRFMILQS